MIILLFPNFIYDTFSIDNINITSPLNTSDMKITLVEKGGVGYGYNLPKVDIDTDKSNISDDDIKKLNTLIQKSKFFELPGILSPPEIKDPMKYKITIDSNKGHHSIEFPPNYINEKEEYKDFAELINFILTFEK